MLSWVMSEVTRLRRRDWRCEEERFRCRYLRAPPAIGVVWRKIGSLRVVGVEVGQGELEICGGFESGSICTKVNW